MESSQGRAMLELDGPRPLVLIVGAGPTAFCLRQSWSDAKWRAW